VRLGDRDIVSVETPHWYVLRRVRGEETLERLLDVAKKRIEFLFAIKTEGDACERIMKEYNHEHAVGNIALCMAAAGSNDTYFMQWLLETEGDIFDILLSKSGMKDRIAVIRDLFDDLVIGLHEISELVGVPSEDILSELSTIRRVKRDAIYELMATFKGYDVASARFSAAYRIVKKGSGIVMKGWVISPLVEFFKIAKSRFQELMKIRIMKIRERILRSDQRDIYVSYADEVIGYWRGKHLKFMPKRDTSKYLMGKKTWQKPMFFPPCSRLLYDRFMSSGYLAHGERVQLALFLKGIGMPLEEQLKFWYRAVDNIGLSWDEFMKKGGYYIRHIYGLEGSKKDYNPPKCETIISKYYCPFCRMNVSELREVLERAYGDIPSDVWDEIREHCLSREYSRACATLLRFCTGGFKVYVVKHPIQFVRIMIKAKSPKVKGRGGC